MSFRTYVTNTTIDSFVNSGHGCFECNGNEPWTIVMKNLMKMRKKNIN